MPKRHYHIAHILPWTTVGGTEHATLRIARAVEGATFESVAFLSQDGASPVKDMFEANGFATKSYEAVEPSYRHPKAFLRASLRLAREFRRQNIDLVHCSDILAGYHAAFAGRLAGLPVLCHVRNRFADLSRRDQSLLRPVHKFVFVSRDTWAQFSYKVPERKGVIVYDGIDVIDGSDQDAARSVREEFGIPEVVKIIGMVARVAPQKDYVTLAKAAARVVSVDPNVRFLIVGDHSVAEDHLKHFAEVRQALEDCNVAAYFTFTGFRVDVSRIISAFDIFVLSTHHEGLPLVILEAMARSRPVVATAVDGVPEIVLDGETGLLHGHEDDAHLAAQLLSLLQDGVRAATLGHAGRVFVETNFTRERFAVNIAKLYEDLIRK